MNSYILKKSIIINRNSSKFLIPEVHLTKKYKPDLVGFDKNSKKTFAYEIKVNKYDLLNDIKMFQYSKYVNYTYLVITKDLLDIAIDKIKDSSIGLIIPYYEGNKLKISSYKKVKNNNNPLLSYEEIKEKCLFSAYWKMEKYLLNNFVS